MFLDKVKKLTKPINQGKHIMIQADLASDKWEHLLLENGFNAMLPTVWIMEGLLYYCTKETTTKLFQIIDRLPVKSSRILFDHWPSNYAKTGREIIKILQSYVDNPIEEFDWFIKNGWNMKKMIDFSRTRQNLWLKTDTDSLE